VRRILVHQRMPVNAETRGFTTPRNGELPEEFRRKNPLITKSDSKGCAYSVGAHCVARTRSIPDVLSLTRLLRLLTARILTAHWL